MSTFFFTLFEALLISVSLSADTFAASFAYGNNKIKIPMLSAQVINIICSSFLGLSLFAGAVVGKFLPERLTSAVCFAILIVLGFIKLTDSITKSIIRKYNQINKQIKFNMFNFKFILNLYANPEDADTDLSKTISPAEAVSLAVALSFDGLAVGFGAALGNVNAFIVVLVSLITNTTAVLLGTCLGAKAADKMNFNLSWLSGAMLIALAFARL